MTLAAHTQGPGAPDYGADNLETPRDRSGVRSLSVSGPSEDGESDRRTRDTGAGTASVRASRGPSDTDPSGSAHADTSGKSRDGRGQVPRTGETSPTDSRTLSGATGVRETRIATSLVARETRAPVSTLPAREDLPLAAAIRATCERGDADAIRSRRSRP